MNITSAFRGEVDAFLLKEGKKIHQGNFHNVSTIVGRTAVLQRLINGANTDKLAIVTYGAVGTDNTAEDEDQTTLGNEVGRVAVDYGDCSVDVVTLTVSFTFSGAWTGTIYEAALFGGVTSSGTVDTGTMHFRVVFPSGIVKATVEEAVVITWTITLSDL